MLTGSSITTHCCQNHYIYRHSTEQRTQGVQYFPTRSSYRKKLSIFRASINFLFNYLSAAERGILLIVLSYQDNLSTNKLSTYILYNYNVNINSGYMYSLCKCIAFYHMPRAGENQLGFSRTMLRKCRNFLGSLSYI